MQCLVRIPGCYLLAMANRIWSDAKGPKWDSFMDVMKLVAERRQRHEQGKTVSFTVISTVKEWWVSRSLSRRRRRRRRQVGNKEDFEKGR